MKCEKIYVVSFLAVLLSGCQLDMKRSVEDYNGSDAAKIRVLDEGKLSLDFYEKDGDCYKSTETRKLTSAFHFSLLSSADYSTGFEKKINMKTPSSFGNKKVKEYAIKAGQPFVITNTNTVSDYSGNNLVYTKRTSFIPESNHEYEIYAKPPEYIRSAGDIVISDLTTHESVKEWKDRDCKSK
nr:hypothetical protein [Pantoea sp. 201603H]